MRVLVSGSRILIASWMVIAVLGFAEASALADVRVYGTKHCLNPVALELQITALVDKLSPDVGSEVSIQVQVSDSLRGNSRVQLVVVLPERALGLEREYELSPSDCPSGADLLLTVIGEFLEELPARAWTGLSRPTRTPAETTTPPAVPILEPKLALSYRLGGIGLVALDNSGGETLVVPEIEFGIAVAFAKQSQSVSLGALARGSRTQNLGVGRFQSTTLLAQLGYQQGRSSWWSAEIRAGTLRVAGSRFSENFVQWLPWVELGAALGYRWGSFDVQASLLAGPLRHQVSAENGNSFSHLPRFRFGIGLTYHLGGQEK